MITAIEETIIILLQNLKIFDFSVVFTRAFDCDFFTVALIFLTFVEILKTKDLLLVFFGIVIILIIKNKIKRKRPFDSNESIKKLNKRKIDKYSFPSGHSFIAELLVMIFKKKFNIEFGTYNYFYSSLIPYAVAFSRVYLGDHYPTDTLSGILFARIFFYIYDTSFKLFVL